jgi:hypothetical protein
MAIATLLKRGFFLVALAAVAACGSSDAGGPAHSPTLYPSNSASNAPTTAVADFRLPPGPTLAEVNLQNAPSYLFLFTHTEDQFNHELSEERYWRVGAMIEAITDEYPGLDITWTIEFQGSDARTVLDRNPETGVADYLRSLHDRGLVQFGYHAHHDPTYNNRPQNQLTSASSYEDVYDALWTWITCEKDPLYGGCVEERGGGLEAVLTGFGEVKIVTGLGVGEGLQLERSAGSQAVRELLPQRRLGYGFPDHGATVSDREYTSARDTLLAIMTPTNDTTSSTLWMDNVLRINDSASVEGVNAMPLRDGPASLAGVLQSLNGSRPFLINIGIADKYLYTVDATSPTKWAYANPQSPELPPQYLNSSEEKERRYQMTSESVDYLGEAVTASNGRLQFVDSEEAVGLFVSDDYWNVDEDELEQIALWMLNHWQDAPPNWVYDGEDFYSLADAFALLAAVLQDRPLDESRISSIFGPWSLAQQRADATSLAVADLRSVLSSELTANGRISETYTVGGSTVTATQVLYALGYLYVYDRYGVAADTIEVPATMNAPETFGLLAQLGCDNCLDTTWSLKPARFQNVASD